MGQVAPQNTIDAKCSPEANVGEQDEHIEAVLAAVLGVPLAGVGTTIAKVDVHTAVDIGETLAQPRSPLTERWWVELPHGHLNVVVRHRVFPSQPETNRGLKQRKPSSTEEKSPVG